MGKKIILILVVAALIFGAWYYRKIEKEKAIFGGKKKSTVVNELRRKWKNEYIRTSTDWIINHATASEEDDIQQKADDNDTSYEDQVNRDVLWMWDNFPENQHPYRESESDPNRNWRKRWIIAETERMGIDTTMIEVEEMMYKV